MSCPSHPHAHTPPLASSQAGSTTYHLFTAGTSTALLLLFVLACDVGVPEAWVPAALRAPLGLHPAPVAGQLVVRWHVAYVFGE